MIEIRRNKALGLIVAAADVTDNNGDKVDLSGVSRQRPHRRQPRSESRKRKG